MCTGLDVAKGRRFPNLTNLSLICGGGGASLVSCNNTFAQFVQKKGRLLPDLQFVCKIWTFTWHLFVVFSLINFHVPGRRCKQISPNEHFIFTSISWFQVVSQSVNGTFFFFSRFSVSTVSTGEPAHLLVDFQTFFACSNRTQGRKESKEFYTNDVIPVKCKCKKEIEQIQRLSSDELPKYCKTSTSAATCKLIFPLKANVQKEWTNSRSSLAELLTAMWLWKAENLHQCHCHCQWNWVSLNIQ